MHEIYSITEAKNLADAHREGLGEILGVLESHLEFAFREMVEPRRSVLAPMPGVMAERLV